MIIRFCSAIAMSLAAHPWQWRGPPCVFPTASTLRGAFGVGRVLTSPSISPMCPSSCVSTATLETTQGQTDGLFRQLPFKYYLPEVASVGDWLQICPWVASRVGIKPPFPQQA